MADAALLKGLMQNYSDHYNTKHQHPLNRLAHLIGIPLIVLAGPLFFLNWRWASGFFVLGWILQVAGHAIEGNQPAFLKSPVYLVIGPLWLARRAADALGRLKTSHR